MDLPPHPNPSPKPPDPTSGGKAASVATTSRLDSSLQAVSSTIGNPSLSSPKPPGSSSGGNSSSVATATCLAVPATTSYHSSVARVSGGSKPSIPSPVNSSFAATAAATLPFVPAAPPSYASITAGTPILQPRFPPILLPSRQTGVKEGKPAVSFTNDEVQVGTNRYKFSLVAKFTYGKPPLAEIQRAFKAHWKITGRATISEVWDGRHVLVIFDSEEDITTALSCPLRKINQSMFRLFRWSIDYNPKKESTITTAWVRLPRLPLPLFDRAYIGEIVSSFAHFLDVDDRTKACLSLKCARACIEIDVTQTIPDKVWINMGDADGFWQDIEVESKLAYCSKCRVHGHGVAVCRKAKASMEHKGKTALKYDYGPDNLFNATTPKRTQERAEPTEKVNPSKPDLKVLPSTEMTSSGSTDMLHVVAPQDEQIELLAMVIYNGPCASSDVQSEINVRVPPPLPKEGGKSSQAEQVLEPPASTSLLRVEAPGEVSPPISDWIPSKKKRKNKGKKVAPSESESALRYSSHVIQAVPNCLGLRHSSRSKKSSENSDFVYHANGMKSGKGKPRKKVSFHEIAEVMSFVEVED